MFTIIAHRANLNGPDPDNENKPTVIRKLLSMGFDVEIDLWVLEDGFYLGHDNPQYKITSEFLEQKGLWIHCKNKKALNTMTYTDLHYFWHQGDDYTITSHGVVWTLVGKTPVPKSICVMPELHSEIDYTRCAGVCTDFPLQFKDLLKYKQIMLSLFRNRVDEKKNVIATYDISSSTNLRDAAWNLAIGQSVGNPSVRNKWETDELFENHSCKILHSEEELQSRQSGRVRIAFPVVNTDWAHDGVTHLLVQLMGGQLDIDIVTRCRLVDLQFPPVVKAYFKGPKYGMSG
jgi:hypothetical protein